MNDKVFLIKIVPSPTGSSLATNGWQAGELAVVGLSLGHRRKHCGGVDGLNLADMKLL